MRRLPSSASKGSIPASGVAQAPRVGLSRGACATPLAGPVCILPYRYNRHKPAWRRPPRCLPYLI